MTGEEFLQRLAAEVVATGDLHWQQRFYSVVEALELVDAIDIDVARRIGQEIRAGLLAHTGEPSSDFFLGSRRHTPRPDRPAIPVPTEAPQVSVRAALASLAAGVGDGGINFVSRQGKTARLVCSGAGPAPWPGCPPPHLPHRRSSH